MRFTKDTVSRINDREKKAIYRKTERLRFDRDSAVKKSNTAVLSSNLKKQRRKRKPVTLHERLSESSSAKRLRKRLKRQKALFGKLSSSQKRSCPVLFTR